MMAMKIEDFFRERQAIGRFDDLDESIAINQLSLQQRRCYEQLVSKADALRHSFDDVSSEQLIMVITKLTEDLEELKKAVERELPF